MYFNLYTTSKAVSGEDCLKINKNLLENYGERCLIVTSKTGAKISGALDEILTIFVEMGIGCRVFDKIAENPLASTVIEGGKVARECEADFILGIGGGSVMDAAKAIAICAKNPDFDIDGLYCRKVPSNALPVVLIGTTSGTGSEVTGVAVLTDDRTGYKKSISGLDCYASLAFMDSKYTYTMGYNTTVTTALDAFAHAVEGFFSPKCSEIPDAYAHLALKNIYEGLKALNETKDVPNKEIRDKLYYGSIYAGLELNACGAAFPHTVGYILTENFHIPHGKACTAFMPYLLKKAKENCPERFFEFLKTVGESEDDIVKTVKELTNIKIYASSEQIDKWCSRWSHVKNFDNTPGGFSNEEAKIALTELVKESII